MAFEIGERVTSSWTGPGTVVGPFERDEDNLPIQQVKFDSDGIVRPRAIGKLQPLDPEDEPKAKTKGRNKIQKAGGDGSKA